MKFFRWMGRAWLMAVVPIPVASSLASYGETGMDSALNLFGGVLSGLVWTAIFASPFVLVTGLVMWGLVTALKDRIGQYPRWVLPVLSGLVGALIGGLSVGWSVGLVGGIAGLIATYFELEPDLSEGRRWAIGFGVVTVMSIALVILYKVL